MKKSLFTLLFFIVCGITAYAQNVGLSFSYFIPKNGYFSTPISPFSVRGVGFDLNRYFAIETGFSLYRMSGLSMKDLPIESKEPFIGPNFTMFVPLELILQLKASKVELDLKAGVFGFHGFSQKLNYGNIDRAIREYEGWQVANSSFTFKNKPGWGYHAGAEITVYVTNQVGVSLESNYLVGSSDLPLTGSYIGGGPAPLETVVASPEFENGKIDFTGLEFSIGLIFETGGGSRPKRPAKRRR